MRGPESMAGFSGELVSLKFFDEGVKRKHLDF